MGVATYTDLTLYRRLLRQARPYWSHIAGILGLRLLSTPLALLMPLPLKIAVDSAIGSHPLPASLDTLLPTAVPRSNTAILFLAVGLLVVISLLVYLRGLGSWLLETYTGEKLVLSFRARLFHHVQRLSLSYHDAKGASDSTYRIQYDTPSIQYVAVHGIIPVVTAGFTLVGMIYVTARIDWHLALVAITVSPVLFVFTRIFQRRIRSEWSKVKDIESYTMAVIQETVATLRIVKAFGQEEREKERFVHHSEKGVRGQIRLALTNGAFDLLIGLTIAAGTAVALFIGVRHVQSGDLTLGNLLLVMAYLAQLYNPLQTVSRKIADLQASLVSAERAFTILDEGQDVVEKPDARRLSRASGAVTFCNVSFTYSNGHEVLSNISYDIPPGSRVGIMGATGAGKTTLISLLTRFYDPTGGRILLDGIDLRDYKLADLRKQFAIVLQEPVLFSTSIAENIGYARPGASDLDIVEAAKAANAHEFIVRLPQGYDSQVGERGMSLSGGERQRVSLARAFLKDAPILILDEPTSSIDMGTEAAVVQAIERLMQGRTAFIVSHRMSALKNCNVTLVIDNGQLVEAKSAVATVAGPGLGCT